MTLLDSLNRHRYRHGNIRANPAPKRPRSEPSNSDSTAGAARKGAAKVISDWAGPILAEMADKLYKRAAQLRRSIKSSKEATSKLQELSAQDKTPSSLTLKLAPAAQKLLPSLPAAAEHIKQAEKAFLEEAMRQRQADEVQDQAELTTILSGAQFELDARATFCLELFTSEQQALFEALILQSKEEFILTMRLSELDISAREEREKDAKAKRAADRERRAMEMDQTPTHDVIKRVVAETVTAQMAKEMAKFRKHANSDSRRKVQFESKQQSRSGSRSRSQSKGRSRSQNKDRDRARGRTKSPRGGSSRDKSRARGRPSTRKPQTRRPSSARTQSRLNSKGGRGTRPRRSPSAKHGGKERSVGASGSRTGARR